MVGSYRHQLPLQTTASSAVGVFRDHVSGLGLQVLIPRKVAAKEIRRFYTPSQVAGWRYYPEAHGKPPFAGADIASAVRSKTAGYVQLMATTNCRGTYPPERLRLSCSMQKRITDPLPISDALESSAISLSNIGIGDVAWPRAETLEVIAQLESTSWAILGGDVLTHTGRRRVRLQQLAL